MIESNVQLNESVDKNKEDVSENVDQTVKLSIKKIQLWKELRRTLNCGKKMGLILWTKLMIKWMKLMLTL